MPIEKTADNDMDICPICGEKWISQCKCFLSDSKCKNGHAWFWCPVHEKKVIGHGDHKKDTMICHCHDGIKSDISPKEISKEEWEADLAGTDEDNSFFY